MISFSSLGSLRIAHPKPPHLSFPDLKPPLKANNASAGLRDEDPDRLGRYGDEPDFFRSTWILREQSEPEAQDDPRMIHQGPPWQIGQVSREETGMETRCP